MTAAHALVEDIDAATIKINCAGPEDAIFIADMTQEAGLCPGGLSWTDLSLGAWFKCEFEGEIVGAVQVLVGYPLGRVEHIVVIPGIAGPLKKTILQSLFVFGCNVLENEGVQVICTTVPDDDPDLACVLAAQGAKAGYRATMMHTVFPGPWSGGSA